MFNCEPVKPEALKYRRTNRAVLWGGLGTFVAGSLLLRSHESTRPYAAVPFWTVLAFNIPFSIAYSVPKYKKLIAEYNRQCAN